MPKATYPGIIPQDVNEDLLKAKILWKNREEARLLFVSLHERGVSYQRIGKAVGLTKQAVRQSILRTKGGDGE